MKYSCLGRGRPGKFVGEEVIGRLQKKKYLILFANWQVLWQNLAMTRRMGQGKPAGAGAGAGAQGYRPISTHSQECFHPYTTGRAILGWEEASKKRANAIMSATKCPLRPLSSLHQSSQNILLAEAWDAVQQQGTCPYLLRLYKPPIYLPSTLSSKLKRTVYSASEQAEVISHLCPSLPCLSVPLLLDAHLRWSGHSVQAAACREGIPAGALPCVTVPWSSLTSQLLF